MVQAGKIDCIIVKDLSRFGRNSIETGYFIERVFPLYHTRFISVSDDFDTANQPFNSFSDFYSTTTSRESQPLTEKYPAYRRIPLIHSSSVAPPEAKLAWTVNCPHLKR